MDKKKFRKLVFSVKGEVEIDDPEELTEDFFYHNARKFIEDGEIRIEKIIDGEDGIITNVTPLIINGKVVKVNQLP